MESPSTETVTAIIEKHRSMLGIDRLDHIETSFIGQGESNLNVLVTVNQSQSFNLRIGLRDKESERSLQGEFDILQLVPNGVGPSPYAVDFSRTQLPQPYMLLEYVDGEPKKIWELDDFQVHARTLARLHQRKFDQHGTPHHLTDASYDFLYRFDVALDYWQTNHAYLLDIPIVARLLPSIRNFVVDNNHLFTNLRRFSVIHGDLHPQNVLFNGDSVSYIDWEWSSIGDPACDVGMIGWDVATNWQMELTGERLDYFLDAYLALEPDDTLRQRRDVWMVYTMCFDQMYHRSQLANDPTGRHLNTMQTIEAYLTQRFL